MFAVAFGIPLSFASLLAGLTLGITSKWGVLRYPWVTGKLVLILSVILVGSFVISGALDDMLNGGGAESELIAAAGYDVLALTVATGLAVYKPGRRMSRRRRGPDSSRG
jgi:predicted Co/Zn/Cd cation transporter (cation efflux family)